MRLRKGVYRLEKGGFFDAYNEYRVYMHFGFGDIWSDTFVSRFIGDRIMSQSFGSQLIYSSDVIERIRNRCIN